MRIYGKGTIFVSPGADHPERPEWMQEYRYGDNFRRKPVMFTVKFENGVAEVDGEIARYMIEQGLASETPVEVAAPPDTAESFPDGQPRRRAPISVGRPLTEVLAELERERRSVGTIVPGSSSSSPS
jgi:hypothetical protein